MVAGLILSRKKDPFIKNHNKRRDYVFFGIAAAIIVVGVVTGLPTLPFWLFPLVLFTYMLLSLRDANRQQDRGERNDS
jgi:flagellar biosynthesis component FlhA